MRCPKCQTNNPDRALFCSRCGVQLPDEEANPSLGNMPTRRPASGPRRFKTGELILRRYRVTGELGQGGMGVVYKCFDETGGIDIALKALPPELSHNSVEMDEVRENFQLVAGLAHPHIATVRTLEKDADTGDYYLILEGVDGVDLRRWRKQKGGKATMEDVLAILRQVAGALDYAHSRKIIHRDIKPSNVMVAHDGTVKVLDFGLAAQIQSSLSRVSQVKYGTSGTGPYMAPEQWRGQFQDAATDQYALAVMAYELLSGHLPFESPDAVVLQQAVLNTPPEVVPALDAPVWNAVARGLAKERSARYPTCAAFVEALATGEAEKPPVLSPAPQSAGTLKSKNHPRKSKLPWVLATVVALLLIGTAGWYFGLHLPEEKRRKAEQEQQEQLKQQQQQQQLAEARAKAEEADRQRKAAEEKSRQEQEARLALEQQQKLAEARARAEEAERQMKAAEEKARQAEEARLALEKQKQEAEHQRQLNIADGIKSAQTALQNGKFADARQQFQAVLLLDDGNALAKTGLADVDKAEKAAAAALAAAAAKNNSVASPAKKFAGTWKGTVDYKNLLIGGNQSCTIAINNEETSATDTLERGLFPITRRTTVNGNTISFRPGLLHEEFFSMAVADDGQTASVTYITPLGTGYGTLKRQ
jgi:serine/threonine protein kinase